MFARLHTCLCARFGACLVLDEEHVGYIKSNEENVGYIDYITSLYINTVPKSGYQVLQAQLPAGYWSPRSMPS